MTIHRASDSQSETALHTVTIDEDAVRAHINNIRLDRGEGGQNVVAQLDVGGPWVKVTSTNLQTGEVDTYVNKNPQLARDIHQAISTLAQSDSYAYDSTVDDIVGNAISRLKKQPGTKQTHTPASAAPAR
ncbi:MAG: hypothetical protein WDN72_09960 [Alphaproteobacteria bacterium]